MPRLRVNLSLHSVLAKVHKGTNPAAPTLKPGKGFEANPSANGKTNEVSVSEGGRFRRRSGATREKKSRRKN